MMQFEEVKQIQKAKAKGRLVFKVGRRGGSAVDGASARVGMESGSTRVGTDGGSAWVGECCVSKFLQGANSRDSCVYELLQRISLCQ